jgi:hypothetical protein
MLHYLVWLQMAAKNATQIHKLFAYSYV